MSSGRVLLAPYLSFALPCLLAILLTDQQDLHLTINSYHQPFLDQFFKYVTILGDGYMLYFILLLAFFRKYWETLMLFTGTAVASIVTQIIKRSLALPRPARVFSENDQLYLVPGIDIHFHHSFPSGHSTTAFAIYFGLALLYPKQRWFFTIVAVIVAFSRVYLSQHFLEDILAGSVIGFAFILISYNLWSRLANSSQRKWLHQNLVKK